MQTGRSWARLLGPAILSALLLAACADRRAPVPNYQALPNGDKAHVDAAIDKYRDCAVDIALKIDDGRARIGPLAWVAAGECVSLSDEIVRVLLDVGLSYDYAIDYASDQRVQATAAAISAVQEKRLGGRR